MFLTRIILHDFKNIPEAEVRFSPKVNCIYGSNGAGKTNLLDAIYYLSMTKSCFSASDQYVYAFGAPEATLCGFYEMDGGTEEKISVAVRRGGEKEVRRGAKAYGRFSEHIGLLPVVMVSPGDSALVSDSGEERRRLANAVLSQMDREYLAAVQAYNRLLAQRNKMLKDFAPDASLLDVLDSRMASHAAVILKARAQFTEQLKPVVAEYYRLISGGGESVSIDYKADAFSPDREKDFAMHYTTSGPQRDDFLFTMDGHPIRRCGSQGQQKSFLVALKFAQYEVMKAACGFPPIMLLDDLFDKLDMNRVGNLLRLVADKEFGQIFLSDSNKVRTESIVDTLTADRSYFETAGGVFTPVNE